MIQNQGRYNQEFIRLWLVEPRKVFQKLRKFAFQNQGFYPINPLLLEKYEKCLIEKSRSSLFSISRVVLR